MHKFNIDFFTKFGEANNSNGTTVCIKFFSGNSAVFIPDYPIQEVLMTLPVRESKIIKDTQ